MKYEEAKIVLRNMRQRFEKSWTKDEKEAFSQAEALIDCKIRDIEQHIKQIAQKR